MFRRMRMGQPLITAAALTSLMLIGVADADESPQVEMPRSPREVLGVTHVAGTYHLTEKNFLVEGVDQIETLGVKVIKLYLTVPPRQYPYNATWPDLKTLVDLANTPAYREVFGREFSTFILTTYSVGHGDHYWVRGITDSQAADEERQFYGLAKHLLTEYRGTGKSFVLQHWEGDWAVRAGFDRKEDPTPQAFRGMIRWLNARQAGVDRARREIGEHGVRVFHAAEVNLVRIGMEEGRPTVTDRVLPSTHLDLVSYSAWDTQGDPKLFRQALDYIAQHMPDKGLLGNRNVYVGEFGAPQNEWPQAKAQWVVSTVIDTAMDWGCPYIVYWQLYCNEARRRPVESNEDVRGFWLIRPDGTRSWAWNELSRRLRH